MLITLVVCWLHDQLLLHEATVVNGDLKRAQMTKHSTPAMAGAFAKYGNPFTTVACVWCLTT